MFLDAALTFTGPNIGGSTAVTSALVPSIGILDMATGAVFNSSTVTTYTADGLIKGNYLQTIYGQSLGDGTNPLEAIAAIGTGFSGGTSLQVFVQGAADASSGSYPANVSGLTWVVLEAGPVVSTAYLTAGQMIPGPNMGSSPPNLLNYRFVRFAYLPVGTFSAGNISFAALGRFPSGIKQMATSASGFYVGA